MLCADVASPHVHPELQPLEPRVRSAEEGEDEVGRQHHGVYQGEMIYNRLIHARGALFLRGGPIPDPALTQGGG